MPLSDIVKAEKKIQDEMHKGKRRLITAVIVGIVLVVGLIIAAAFATKEISLSGLMIDETIHICDYCDLKYELPSVYVLDANMPRYVVLQNSQGGEARRLCVDCFIKVFDKVLGEPIYKKDKEAK